jgi:hypothetical protein
MNTRSTPVLTLIAVLAFSFLQPGCVNTELRVDNQTGTGLQVYSGHTKQVTSIPAGAVVAVPHSSGRMIIISHRDQVWEYDEVTTVGDEANRSDFKVSLPVKLEPDGTMILPSGKQLAPSHELAGEPPR